MTPAPHQTAKLIAEVISAAFGMIGSWLMARRYAREPFRALFFAVIWPIAFLIAGRQQLHEFLAEKIKLNEDVPDSPFGMVLGLSCLLIAFLVQIVVVYLEANG